MTEKRIQNLKTMIQRSRSRLADIQPDFPILLRRLIYVADKSTYRISTNGKCIYFDPDWLQRLTEDELDFILAHEAMHILLGHIDRDTYFMGERFHLTCDIIVNAHLEVIGWNFDNLPPMPHIGTIYRKTFYPVMSGYELIPEDAIKMVPFDPSKVSGSRKKYVIDSDYWWDQKDDCGENGIIVLRPGEEDPYDAGQFTETETEEKYNIRRNFEKPERRKKTHRSEDTETTPVVRTVGYAESSRKKDLSARLKALNDFKAEMASDNETDPRTRLWNQIRRSKLDWRKLLNVFVREDLCDYSFTPPDKRFSEEDLFLPDYNVLSEKTKNILFMVDTSTSVEDDILSIVYSELCSALYQFGNSLHGILAFFDSRVYTPVKFDSISDLKSIKPTGGGTTDFNCVFEYIRRYMMDQPPLSIVIFTDGKGDFPPEEAAMNIPVLWMITNSHYLPEWGRCVVVEE